jgi:molybdopterin synthase sulfur carrier subunit
MRQIMVTVEFLGPIGKDDITLDAKTLADVAKVLQQDDEVNAWLSKCAVALNDNIVSDLDIKLKDGDKISLLPPVCGG